ncbi:erythritol transport system substrate-binding protein [Mycetocola sp. BIGb0189]|uniref:D-ribose ABC transporter substrate-binding protein n=1 Tax=Mycetocola sp. BIGb0189 TaxID=2940604 RepID=UPI0021697026|nr:D-ribose ABC transporter substrate-binding protein [Mycetocola sp. BIGb0189]MCS4276848.1 erythritol transport system substrate-binding protein [Mycetocola sp. BIGb0189]
MFRSKAAKALAIGALAALTLSGCAAGGSDKPADGKDTKGGLISLVTSPLDNPYWTTEANTVKAEGEKLGYKVNISSHAQDPKKESDLIDTAISNKSVAIVLDPAGADSSIGNVRRATDAGIPVFLVNAEINTSGLAKAQLVSNNAQGAVLGAQQFVQAMGNSGKYVELKGLSTDTNAEVRSTGYASVLGQFPELELVQQETADWDQKKGFDKMQLMLQAHPDIKGVISGNDQMALGAIAALKQAGMLDRVVVGGFDGAPDAVTAVGAGELAYTVVQPVVDFSTAVVKQIDEFLKTGKTGVKDEKQSFDCFLVTKETASEWVDFQRKG